MHASWISGSYCRCTDGKCARRLSCARYLQVEIDRMNAAEFPDVPQHFSYTETMDPLGTKCPAFIKVPKH